MTAQTKTILKTYFETGDRPTQAQFTNLIDSFTQTASSNGLIAQVSAGDSQARTIQGTTNQIAVSAGNGVAGNPTISFSPIVDLTGSNTIVATASAGDSSTRAANASFVQNLISAAVSANHTSYKFGTFSKNIADANTSQSITGVGFTPKAVLCFGGVISTEKYSIIGMTDGVTSRAIANNNSVNAGTFDDTGSLIYIISSSGSNFTQGFFSSFDADGFTISWTKTGTPTGTANIYYLAMR